MSDSIYAASSVPSDVRPLFSQLKVEFSEHEIWVRRENFGRTVFAAVINRKRGVAVTVPVVRPGFRRTREFEQIELGRIRSHLEIGSDDLALP